MEKPPIELTDSEIAVHYIDVGQGDCQLIVTPDKAILIDCGEEIYADKIMRYLNSHGIYKLDLVIGTHPHSDHIGSLSRILREFPVEKLLMPELSDEIIPLSECYESVLDAIEDKNIPAVYAPVGENYDLGKGTRLYFLAPVHNDYEELNNFSVVTQLVHGENSFLFTGDIERASENDLLNSRTYIESDVLKVAHHGSTSSSTPSFLRAVDPEYAVVSVGRYNSYGHPSPTVVQRLYDVGAEILTTAEYGSIVFVSDGTNLYIKTERGSRTE